MQIPSINSFTVHRLGVERSFFPFGIDVLQKEDVIHINVFPQRVIDLCDIIESHALEYLVIFGVDQYSQFDVRTQKELSIEGLAANVKVPFSTIDSESIVLPKQELFRLLSTFRHYDLSLFDVESSWREDQIKNQIPMCDECQHDWRIEPVLLPKLTASRFYLISGEDRHTSIETYNPDVPRQIFSKALQFYVGTVLMEKDRSVSDIAEVPKELLDMFWKDNFSLTILNEATELLTDRLKVGVTKRSYNFSKPLGYVPEFWICYQIQTQKWLVEM